MGVGFELVNFTQRERVQYLHVEGTKARELAGNSVPAAITTWYLLMHSGDHVAFVSDTYSEWPFPTGSRDDLTEYREVTDEVVDELIQVGILEDRGRRYEDADDPDHIYIRDLVKLWEEPSAEPRELPDARDLLSRMDTRYRAHRPK